jgi:beta-lactam-binding protein with PASTA domain
LDKELVGKTEIEIKDRLERDNLELHIEIREETVEEENEKMESGKATRITTTDNKPLPQEMTAGSTIVVYISKGIEQITVPNLVGMTEEDAMIAIVAAKLQYKSTSTVSDPSKSNGVIDYTPKGLVDKNTPITITVNNYEARKTGTATVNIRSISANRGWIPKDPDTGEYKDKQVEVIVTVIDKNGTSSNTDRKTVSILSTSTSLEIAGSGVCTVKITIDGIDAGTGQIDFNKQTNITI